MTYEATTQAFTNFYLLCGGASATLTGLMFVAVTFGASLASKDTLDTMRAFVDPIFAHFVHVFVIACLFVVPTLGSTGLGACLLATAAYRLVRLVSVFRHVRLAHRKYADVEASDWLINVALPACVYALLVAVGVGFIQRRPLAFDGLAVCTVALLLLGIVGAWELLLWMASKVAKPGSSPGA